METTILTTSTQNVAITNTKTKGYKKTWEMLEFNRFGVIAFVLSIVACTSGITAGLFIDGNSQLDITMVALPTMITLCSILIVAPIRWIIGAGAAALLIDLLIIFI